MIRSIVMATLMVALGAGVPALADDAEGCTGIGGVLLKTEPGAKPAKAPAKSLLQALLKEPGYCRPRR
jgi:hypothetical protein